MNEYYGNNDWRDYLAHYGVKGMKWGKRKSYKYKTGTIGTVNYPDTKGVYIRKDSNNDDYGHKIGVDYTTYNGNKKINFYNTKNNKYQDDYWKNTSKYEKKNRKGGILERTYAEDGVTYTINLSLAKKKVSSLTNQAKSKVTSFIKSISNKFLKKRR